jgi:anthranilate phosphoribosyltransferase
MIKEAIKALVSRNSLSETEAFAAMSEMMAGEVTPAQFGAFVTALRLKGETVDEIVGLVRAMRTKVVPVSTYNTTVDTCGTGGDHAATFNISTLAAFVVAGSGIRVAKHGNRAMTSRCGSADVLEALGVKIDLNAHQVEQCLSKTGICFMFAPIFHPAMKHVAAPRREIGFRTVFNIIGPLTNPANAQYQVIGVPDQETGEKVAAALCRLGTKGSLIVYGQSGMDELSINGKSKAWEIKEYSRDARSFDIIPADFGFEEEDISALRGGMPEENAIIFREILSGEISARRNVVVMNAAAAIALTQKGMIDINALYKCARLAEQSIDNGKARQKLEELVLLSRGLSEQT